MNEDQLIDLLKNLDDDLVEKEINKLLEGVEIDMDSIHKKANEKLRNNNKKVKSRKKLPYVAAACVCLFSITAVYADDISQAIQSFFNKTPVYSTVVDGEAYYLKGSKSLDKNIKLESVMVSEGNLEVELSSDLSEEELENISIISKNDLNTIYEVGGYSKEGDKYSFSFANEKEKNYNIKPFKEFTLMIAGKSYDVSLEKAKSLDANSKICTNDSQKNIEGVNMGAKLIDNNEKLNIQLIASFNDKDLKLSSLGTPIDKKVVSVTENKKDGIFGSGTSSRTEDLYVWDKMNNKYKLEIPKDAKGRPVTTFETNAPKGENLTVKVPAIIAGYEKTMDSFKLDIPESGEANVNKEIDFKVQKAIMKSIKRVSPTSAQIEFELNTHRDKNITIRSFDLYSKDFKKISTEINGNKGIVNLEFDKDMENTNIEISYPDFVMNGDWTIDMK
ncbi:hypothetical protein [Inediibacterium massiliense]|uniref:hypothetical protein n=1 Tax=Inediibacterium massiliense TaxID=1658111 RepID=UPI0006B52B20|nr:hypothetical protein [Inediibacterium massiliense]